MTAADSTRRVRPTLRCLREDLRLPDPPRSTRLDELDHRVLRKAAGLAPAHPRNQVRILEIDDPLVFRFTHGRDRVITWLDEHADILWICGCDLRREDTAYDRYLDLHRRGELLPAEEDGQRLEDEALLQLAATIREEVPRWVAQARVEADSEHRFELPGGAPVLVFVRSGTTEEIWIALPTMLAEDIGLPATVRGLVVATVTETLGGPATAECEERSDWPTNRPLRNYEVAFFWIT